LRGKRTCLGEEVTALGADSGLRGKDSVAAVAFARGGLGHVLTLLLRLRLQGKLASVLGQAVLSRATGMVQDDRARPLAGEWICPRAQNAPCLLDVEPRRLRGAREDAAFDGRKVRALAENSAVGHNACFPTHEPSENGVAIGRGRPAVQVFGGDAG